MHAARRCRAGRRRDGHHLARPKLPPPIIAPARHGGVAVRFQLRLDGLDFGSPPQTRKLLVLVRDLVLARAQAQGEPRPEVRFTRKDVREATGWGDTQLKVHLARLVELEYLLVHRQGQGHVYELLYDGDGRNVPYLCGLLDPAHLYDGQRSGHSDARSGPSRCRVGPRSGRAVGHRANASTASSHLPGKPAGHAAPPGRQGRIVLAAGHVPLSRRRGMTCREPGNA